MPINAIIYHVQNSAQKILPTLTLGEKHGIKSPAFKNRSIPVENNYNRPLGTINRGENYRDYGKTNSGL